MNKHPEIFMFKFQSQRSDNMIENWNAAAPQAFLLNNCIVIILQGNYTFLSTAYAYINLNY